MPKTLSDLSQEQLYNLLMAEIEPELLTMVVPHLDEIYKDENPEQKARRAKRYAKAFALFLKRQTAFLEACKHQLLDVKSLVLEAVQILNKDQQDTELSRIAEDIENNQNT